MAVMDPRLLVLIRLRVMRRNQAVSISIVSISMGRGGAKRGILPQMLVPRPARELAKSHTSGRYYFQGEAVPESAAQRKLVSSRYG